MMNKSYRGFFKMDKVFVKLKNLWMQKRKISDVLCRKIDTSTLMRSCIGAQSIEKEVSFQDFTVSFKMNKKYFQHL